MNTVPRANTRPLFVWMFSVLHFTPETSQVNDLYKHKDCTLDGINIFRPSCKTCLSNSKTPLIVSGYVVLISCLFNISLVMGCWELLPMTWAGGIDP